MASGGGGNWSELVGPARFVALTREHVVTGVGSTLRAWNLVSDSADPTETVDLGSPVTALAGNEDIVVAGLADGRLMAWEVGRDAPVGLDGVVEAVNAGSGTPGTITSLAMTFRGRLVIGRSDGRVAVVAPSSVADAIGPIRHAPVAVFENLAGVAAIEPWNVAYTDAELVVWQGKSATDRMREQRISAESPIRPGTVSVSLGHVGWVGLDGTAWRCQIVGGRPDRLAGEGHAAILLPEGAGEPVFVGEAYGDAPTAVAGTAERSVRAFRQGRVQLVTQREGARDFNGHTASIVFVARAGDDLVVSAQSDGHIRWWRPSTGDLTGGVAGGPVRALCAGDGLTYVARIDGSIEALAAQTADPAGAPPIGETLETVQLSPASDAAVARWPGTGERVLELTLGRRLIAVTARALVALDPQTLELGQTMTILHVGGPVVELDDGRIFVGEVGQPREVGGTGHTDPEWPTAAILVEMAPHGVGGIATIHRDGSVVEWEGAETDSAEIVVPDLGGGSPIRAVDGLDGDITIAVTRGGSLAVLDRATRAVTHQSVPLDESPIGVALVGTTAVVHDGNRLAAVDLALADGHPADGDAEVPQQLGNLDADSPASVDLLGARRDAIALARVLAARSTKEPIAVALLGEWGSGKSTFMKLVKNEVDDLGARARRLCAAEESPSASSYVPTIAQVCFNAWTYADSHLWAGMIRQIFEDLSRGSGMDEAAAAVTAEERVALADKLDTATERLATAKADLARRDDVARKLEALPWPLRQRAIVGHAVRTGAEAADAYRRIRPRLRALLRWSVPLAAVGAVLLVIATNADEQVADAARAIGGLLVAIGGLASAVLGFWTSRVGSWEKTAGDALAKVVGAEQAHEVLVARCESEQQQVDALTRELAQTDPSRRLLRFLEDRRNTTDYDTYRGLLSLVHEDLEQLSARMTAPTEVPDDEATWPVERIIVYVDDLDRCSPDRVVDVLAAVHLMLAVRKFIVVVAVDPRWLLRCLQYHYSKLLDADDTGGPMATTPIDYLEKIFQLAYRVPKMDTGFDGFMRGLLPVGDPARGSASPGADRARGPVGADLSPPADGRSTVDGAANTPVTTADARPAGERSREGRDGESVTDAPGRPVSADVIGGERSTPVGTADAEPTASTTTAGGRYGDVSDADGAADPADDREHGSDLVAAALVVSAEEQNVAAVLEPLLETPRAVKRLANSYRLFRASVRADDLDAYLAERRFEPVLVLLGAAIGQPLAAPAIFHRISSADDGTPIADVFGSPVLASSSPSADSGSDGVTPRRDSPTTQDPAATDLSPRQATGASAVDGGAVDISGAVGRRSPTTAGPTKDAGPVPDRSSEHEAIDRFRRVLAAPALTVTDVRAYRDCIEHVARFSFRYMELTGRVAGGTGRPGIVSAPASGPPPSPPGTTDSPTDGSPTADPA